MAAAPAAAKSNTKVEPKAAAALESATLRVSVEKVDQLINLVGELVITQAMLAQNSKGLNVGLNQQMSAGLADLVRNTRDLQDAVMSIRMIPMSMVFNRFPRMLRDLAARLGKKVELVTLGESTELDKGMVEKITDPLTHLVRNSCDHGIELPADRLGGEEYGIDILRVQEIRFYEQPTRIANAPAFLKGVVKLRGVIVPIIDLRLKLGCLNAQGLADYNHFTVVIVLNVRGRVVGAVVDSVSDVLALGGDAIRPAPGMNATIDPSFITGIGSVAERMLILMDIEALMSSTDMGQMDAPLN